MRNVKCLSTQYNGYWPKAPRFNYLNLGKDTTRYNLQLQQANIGVLHTSLDVVFLGKKMISMLENLYSSAGSCELTFSMRRRIFLSC